MNDFEDKLNAILSNPDAMAQVMNLAQSLGSTLSPPSLSQQEKTAQHSPPPDPSQDPPSRVDDIFALLDPAMIGKFLPLLSELNRGGNDDRLQLLMALKPFLKPERQDKVDRALKAARLIRLGKKLLTTMGETNV